MAQIIEFKLRNTCECPECVNTETEVIEYECDDTSDSDVINEYLDYIFESGGNPETLVEIIRDLYFDAKRMGYKKALEEDVHAKLEVLGDMDNVCVCGENHD